MSILDLDVDTPILAPTRGSTGPVTAGRQRRTFLIYISMLIIGAVPWLIGADAGWQAAGLGLWLPGAGFLAVGGWWSLLFVVTIALFVVSLIAWFWAGVVIAPVTVWAGAALIAGLLAPEQAWTPAPFIAALILAGLVYRSRASKQRDQARGAKIAAKREAYLPEALAQVSIDSQNLPDPTRREMTDDQLAGVRYLLDRSLQPLETFDGFNIIDQFQPAALRYQLNHMGFALSVAQAAYLPNFRGYFGLAQRNLIEKFLIPKVWRYWALESCWGHLNFTDWNPAGRDNIMLTGWYGVQLGAYMLASGDKRYLEKGSLPFRLNRFQSWAHDFGTIAGSLDDNYKRSKFGIFACEPNWIYPICNHYGMLALASYDRLTGSDLVGRHMSNWLRGLDTEFTDASGSMIGLRSELTGFAVNFPVKEAGYCYFANGFLPARAKKLWAIARHELEHMLIDEPDGPRLKLPGPGLDVGNYGKGHTMSYGTYLVAAREFGDTRLAEAALRGLEYECEPVRENGTLRYVKGSNYGNALAIMGLLMETGDFRRASAVGTDAAALAGPMIETVDYPNVLVARAWSDGERLEAVFRPGAAPGQFTVPLSQLKPGHTYSVSGAAAPQITADADGKAEIRIDLQGRLEVALRPET